VASAESAESSHAPVSRPVSGTPRSAAARVDAHLAAPNHSPKAVARAAKSTLVRANAMLRAAGALGALGARAA
jgi:hypothetical protein